MSEFVLGWSNEHDLSEPLTGALFDLWLDFYHLELLARGLIAPDLARFVVEVGHLRSYAGAIQAEFDRYFERGPAAFVDSFIAARDRMAEYMCALLSGLSPNDLTYVEVRDIMLAVDRTFGSGLMQKQILDNFDWREIGKVPLGPYLGQSARDRRSAARIHRCAQRGSGPIGKRYLNQN